MKNTDFKGRRRGRFRIIHEILSCCQKPKKKTCIMHQCNLSYDSIQNYLKLLIAKGLLNSFDGKKGELYQTSDKGRSFVASYEQLKKLLLHEIGPA